MFERLKFEYFEDECFIEELIDVFFCLGVVDLMFNVEIIGYMLCGYFVSMCCYIVFE